jgi:hypothetical protein
MIGAALIANPIGLAITVIAGSALLIYKNWDTIGPWFKSLWENVETYFGGFTDFVGGTFTGDMERAADGVGSMWQGTKGVVGLALDGLGTNFDLAWRNVIKPVTDAMGVTGQIERAWAVTSGEVGGLIRSVGTAFNSSWTTYISPVIEGLSATGGIGAAWETVKSALGGVLDWIASKFEWLGGIISPIIDKIIWVKEKGAGILSAIGIGGGDEGASAPAGTTQMSPVGGPAFRPQQNASGGPFGPGWHLTGEKGPELKFENRAGYVANNRAMRQLANFSGKVGSGMPKMGLAMRQVRKPMRAAATSGIGQMKPAQMARTASAVSGGSDMDSIKALIASITSGGPQGGADVTSPGGSTSQTIVKHITIQAQGANAQEVARLVREDDRRDRASRLFDGGPSSFPGGR